MLGARRRLTCTVVDVKEATLGTQQLIGDHGIDVQVRIEGQDGPIEHREGGPWARGEGSLQGQPGPPPPPPPLSGEPWLTMNEREGGEVDGVRRPWPGCGSLGRLTQMPGERPQSPAGEKTQQW